MDDAAKDSTAHCTMQLNRDKATLTSAPSTTAARTCRAFTPSMRSSVGACGLGVRADEDVPGRSHCFAPKITLLRSALTSSPTAVCP